MSEYSNEDDFEDLERDLLGDMAPASWHAPDDWWSRQYAALDDAGRAMLVAGELSITVMSPSGVEKVRLQPPGWLVEEHAAR